MLAAIPPGNYKVLKKQINSANLLLGRITNECSMSREDEQTNRVPIDILPVVRA